MLAGAATSTAGPAAASESDVRAQVDTVGFASSWDDFESVLAAALAEEGMTPADAQPVVGGPTWVAAIVPHDDYVYAGRTAVHALAGLRARHWLVVGVCHACRRIGLRDRVLFDSYRAWRVAGVDIPVDAELRAALLTRLDPEAFTVNDERHAAEHSVEALLPWLRAAQPEAVFVPVLVAGMDFDHLRALAGDLAEALAAICVENGWLPGRDLGVLISADAVHYGCSGWGESGGHHPFGCDEVGHAAAVARDITLAEATLAGWVNEDALARFARLVWDPDNPDYPYKITWCGLYSIPFGLSLAEDLQAALERPRLWGELLRYGDSVSDGRLEVPETELGVTAPNTLEHWVGYPALGYRAAPTRP
jgi:AmmeMemoRadiSam system protein B